MDLHECERRLMERLRAVYGGAPWIVAGQIVQGIAPGAIRLRGLGAADVLVIATEEGVGELPSDLRWICSDGAQADETATFVERMQDNNRELHDLPKWVIEEVDAWDPGRRARVIVNFTADAGLVAERPTFGARELRWAALEDKLAIRDVWRRAGITTAPDRVVELADVDGLVAAHRALATELGTVWAVDNRRSWHGGGEGTHWVATEADAPTMATRLAGRNDAVRVQPFLSGVPCSIHGMVLATSTLAFRPCEMIVLLDHSDHTFHYSRAATFWDPPDCDRNDMRATARSVGDALRDEVDFRGVFTLDGVLTADGFRPTEVNPRFGAALPQRLPTVDGTEIPMYFTHLAAVEGHLDDFDPTTLEALLVERMDEHRTGNAFVRVASGPPDGEVAIRLDANLEPTESESDTLLSATWGAAPTGGLIIISFETAMQVGPPVAPTIAAARSVLAAHWGIEIAELQPAFGQPVS